MFCYQCEQHKAGYCDSDKGICGKDETTAALQDLLLYSSRGIASYLVAAREVGVKNRKAERFVIEALFTTVTNVNFDANDVHRQINESIEVREALKAEYVAAGGTKTFSGPATWSPAGDVASLVSQNQFVGISDRTGEKGQDFVGLQELLTYGLKGTAAYAEHAAILGYEDDQIYADLVDGVEFLNNNDATVEELTGWSLKCGDVNLRVMALLDQAHTDTYGKQVPTAVPITAVEGKAILVSGHDMKDLQLLLEQTEGKGVNIYTHGEMITAHAYPELKKYDHLIGNYGGAWQRQAIEFAQFPGAILMTTNCIQEPKVSYVERIFTTGLVAWPNVTHIGDDKDFTPVIESALASEGFTATEEEKTIMIGFGHDAVLGVADTVVGAIKSGDLRHFFLVGGCDGAKAGRNYYTEMAEQIPDDCVILTLACGKYRFNKLEFGDIGGIPRLLDMGQCNDAYSAIKVASTLAEVFECGVNDLPLSMILSWYEQKAVAILLTLLNLGIKDIRLGPSLPAFVTEPVLN
ncbi:hydroxylamine reductase, partial [bacterium M21]